MMDSSNVLIERQFLASLLIERLYYSKTFLLSGLITKLAKLKKAKLGYIERS